MKISTIAVLGGSGFVGTHIVNRLNALGLDVRVFTRRREQHRHLLVIPTLKLVETDVHNPTELQHQLAGCDAVINLVGILNERGDDGSGFQHAHVELTRKLIAASKANGIKRYLHMSALHANAQQGPSHYLKSKGQAEELVLAATAPDFAVTSFRPSVIFGREDSFFNRFAGILRITPYFFPLACAQSKFAPVFVGDVADAFVKSLDDPRTFGQCYDLCGPRVYTLQGIVEYTAKLLGRKCKVIALSPELSHLQARILDHVPGKPMSLDNYRSLQVDSVCSGEDGLARLGITPTSVETIVPAYLEHRSQRSRYNIFRSHARRQ